MKTLGQRVKHVMQARGIGPNQLDRMLGKSAGFTSRLSNDRKVRTPDADTMRLLARVLGVSVEWLLDGGASPLLTDVASPEYVARQRNNSVWHSVVEDAGGIFTSRCGKARGGRTTWAFAPPKHPELSCAACRQIQQDRLEAALRERQAAQQQQTTQQRLDELQRLQSEIQRQLDELRKVAG